MTLGGEGCSSAAVVQKLFSCAGFNAWFMFYVAQRANGRTGLNSNARGRVMIAKHGRCMVHKTWKLQRCRWSFCCVCEPRLIPSKSYPGRAWACSITLFRNVCGTNYHPDSNEKHHHHRSLLIDCVVQGKRSASWVTPIGTCFDTCGLMFCRPPNQFSVFELSLTQCAMASIQPGKLSVTFW